jgi:hypothetical protein
MPLCSAAILMSAPLAQENRFDLSRPPDPGTLSANCTAAGIGAFRQRLADALISAWEPATGRSPGSCARDGFARWVDLSVWVALLATEESSVTKRWLSRHVSAEKDEAGGKTGIRLTVHEPGSSVVIRYDDFQHQAVEHLTADPGLLARAMDSLVAKPYSPHNGPLITRLEKGFVEEATGNPRFLKLWCENFSEDDFAPKALMNLQSIWKKSPADFREFPELALAIALVRDQPAPVFWPHRQVSPAAFHRGDQSPAELFSEFVSAYRRGKLRRDLHSTGVRALMFVVDSPLSSSESEWVRSDRLASRQDPPAALASINYDESRMLSQSYVWPWGEYRLEAIRRRGGICIDQAYYASSCAKALGIPAMMFAGLGKEGGHAWVGYLRRGGSWDFSAGRPPGQGLATGETMDPRNWTPVTDHEMESLISGRLASRREASGSDLAMAALFRLRGNATGEGDAIRSALARDRDCPEYWDAREDWLVRTGAAPGELKDHHQAAIRNFSFSRDLKARHEEALARLDAKTGDRVSAERLDRQILEENKKGRGDLSAAATARLLKSKLDSGDPEAPEAALREYRKQLVAQGDGGSDFFYRVTVPFCGFLVSKGRPDLSRRILKEAYDVIKPRRGNLLDHDFRTLWKQAGGVE